MKKRVLLGMSGGVDSSVSAILLKKEGYEVIGATIKMWKPKGCENIASIEDAQKVAKQIGIEHIIIESEELFTEKVINNFINCYEIGKTPNPCIECNKYIKFGIFLEKANELNCDYIATGHYAKVEFSEKFNQIVLKKAISESKDQSYFLYGISKDALPRIIFPLEKIESKEDVRKIAEENNLCVAKKSDSQEVCFIPDNDYGKFLEENLDELPNKGKIILKDGTILGEHKGLIYYTIGQRKGLGVAYKEPLYVLELDRKNNQVIVGIEKELYTREVYVSELNFLINIDLSLPIEVYAKVRYRARPAKAKIEVLDNNSAKIVFDEPQRAITPGQSVVFYLDEVVLGGGKI